MCGRVVQARPLDVLAELFDAVPTPKLAGSYAPAWNIAPTEPLVGLTAGLRAGVLDSYAWGLRGRFFNARAETVATNATFSGALRARRLAVLVDGFYEWQERRPRYFQRADGAPLALAGLWEAGACTVITTAAGADLAGIHDRSPVVLEGPALAAWLASGALGAAALARFFAPAPAGTLVHHHVDPRVGNVGNDGPELVLPVLEPEPLRLFGDG